MAYQRTIYETAFDCKNNKSDDNFDDLHKLTQDALLISKMKNDKLLSTVPLSFENTSTKSTKQSMQSFHQRSQSAIENRRKLFFLLTKTSNKKNQQHLVHTLVHDSLPKKKLNITSSISKDKELVRLNSSEKKFSLNHSLNSLPSYTTLLLARFHGLNFQLLNVQEASRLPSREQKSNHFKHMQSPYAHTENLKQHSSFSNENNGLEVEAQKRNYVQKSKEFILEFKSKKNEPSSVQQPVPAVKKQCIRPSNLICENKLIREFKGRPYDTHSIQATQVCWDQPTCLFKMKLHLCRLQADFSSMESITTSSSGGSIESLHSITSGGNRSISSNESHRSTSLSLHSSDSGGYSTSNSLYHQHEKSSLLNLHTVKMHTLSLISDKSLQEPLNEPTDNNPNNTLQKFLPNEQCSKSFNDKFEPLQMNSVSNEKNQIFFSKNCMNLAFQSYSSIEGEILGSNNEVLIESRTGIKCDRSFSSNSFRTEQLRHNKKLEQQRYQELQQSNKQVSNDSNQTHSNSQAILDLSFDMQKLLQHDTTISSSSAYVDLKDLPFEMPKLRRRLGCTQNMQDQISSNQFVKKVDSSFIRGDNLTRSKMELNLQNSKSKEQFEKIAGKSDRFNPDLSLRFDPLRISADLVDILLPLERQGWYHGSITRIEAEATLRLLREGSYLVRNIKSTKKDYFLSLKSAKGFMHIRIQKNEESNTFMLGQFNQSFNSIPEIVRHFSINRLPIRGAEHMCLLHPVIVQLL